MATSPRAPRQVPIWSLDQSERKESTKRREGKEQGCKRGGSGPGLVCLVLCSVWESVDVGKWVRGEREEEKEERALEPKREASRAFTKQQEQQRYGVTAIQRYTRDIQGRSEGYTKTQDEGLVAL